MDREFLGLRIVIAMIIAVLLTITLFPVILFLVILGVSFVLSFGAVTYLFEIFSKHFGSEKSKKEET
jgi:hypothetical protein